MTRITIRHTTSAARARLFFAVYPSDAVRKRIAEVQAGFDAVVARTTTLDNFHLTLAFLGETATEEPCTSACNVRSRRAATTTDVNSGRT